MSIPSGVLQSNLNRLSQELAASAQHSQLPIDPSPLALKLSGGLFLAHSTADEKFAEICEAQSLVSKSTFAASGKMELEPTCDEAVLGTSNDVFFYVAPFRYPRTTCGFLFAPTLELAHKDTGVATPFDSGGLIRHVMRQNPEELVQEFLARHELPIPEHRQYLSHVMTTLFGKAEHYVEGIAQCNPCPIGLSGGDQRRWTHEVRIPGTVQVEGNPHLAAIFAPIRATSDLRVEALLRWCDLMSVEKILFETPKADDFAELQRACLTYIKRALY